MSDSEALVLSHGRVLSYAVYGSPVPKTTVFYFHASPSSRKEGKLWHTAASKLNVRLIAPDRPGMGNSSPQPNRTFLDWPKDVITLADHLKIERFYVMGLSGGGPYSLACVKAIPKERLAGAAVVSGLYPVSLGTEGMILAERFILWVGPWMTGLLGGIMDMTIGKAARDPNPKHFEDRMLKDIENGPEADREAIKNSKNRRDFIEGKREGMRQGGQGAAWETKMYGNPWGFELQELQVGEDGIPLALWHGTKDVNCPPAMATKAKEAIPKAVLHMEDGEGHVSYALRNQEEILADLIGALEIYD